MNLPDFSSVIPDFKNKNQRKKEREFYQQTQANANSPRRNPDRGNVKAKTEADPEWYYLLPTWLITVPGYMLVCVIVQYLAAKIITLPKAVPDTGFFHNYGLTKWYFILGIFIMPAIFFYTRHKLRAIWFNNNAMYLTEDIQGYETDSYVRSIDHLTQELYPAPDVGLGFDGHVSTIMGHMMVSNKGIKKIKVPVYDPNVDGFVKTDENGDIVYETKPMFDKDLAEVLYDMSMVPHEYRTYFDATDYDFNRKVSRKEGGDGKKRAGEYDRPAYDKLSDYINNEFYVLDTETARPAGIYFYDNRPVNTILIAITRGGKGQTYIEPA